MGKSWPLVPLGETLTERREVPSDESIATGETPIVAKIGFDDGRIQLRRDGRTRTGMILVRPGDLVVSGINAFKGAIAVYGAENSIPIAATIHYAAYTPNKKRIDVPFLWYLLRSRNFQELLLQYVPGGIKTELKAKRLLPVPIPLPPLSEQQRIVACIEALAAKIEEAKRLNRQIEQDADKLLLGAFYKLISGAKEEPMQKIAPITRRPVKIDTASSYPEIGIRSFGKGTFHKPNLSGWEVGSKKLYEVQAGDLLFNNVFAWEGATAVVQPEDAGRVGSHRFIACVPKKEVVTANFLRFYFLTEEGLEKIGLASPGGAGRNRTLGLEKLEAIAVPIPSFEKQLWFDKLQSTVEKIRDKLSQTTLELDALIPSILDKAFKGAL